MIKYCAVKQIEYISAKHRRQSDHTPVLAQAGNAKCVCYDRWEDAEEKAVGYTCEGGEEVEVVRIVDGCAGDLRQGEDD